MIGLARRRGVGTPPPPTPHTSIANNVSVGTESSSTVTPLTSPTFAATTGNSIIVFVEYAAGSISSVTDTAGNTYASVAAATTTGGTNKIATYVAQNITGNAANAVSVANSCTFASVHVFEVAGAVTAGAVDAAAATFANTLVTPTTPSFSTAQAQEMLVMIVAASSGFDMTALKIGGVTATLGTFVKFDGTHKNCQTGWLGEAAIQSSITATATNGGSGHSAIAVVGIEGT